MGSLASKLVLLGRDIKLAHSVFALPFALLTAFWAAQWRGRMLSAGELLIILWCMFFARTYAMLANRYVDRNLDAANPRTAARALPSMKLHTSEVMIAIFISAVALILGAAMFSLLYSNEWPLFVSPIVLIWLGAYGLFKRFSLVSHFILGGALAISPIATTLAIAPSALQESTPWLLAGFVALWVAGFDVIYAMQDIDVDRQTGLHSIPAKLGPVVALLVAKAAHLLGLLLLVLCYLWTPAFANAPRHHFLVACVGVAILIIIEHWAAARGKFSMAFFTYNGIIALLLGASGIADILMR